MKFLAIFIINVIIGHYKVDIILEDIFDIGVFDLLFFPLLQTILTILILRISNKNKNVSMNIWLTFSLMVLGNILGVVMFHSYLFNTLIIFASIDVSIVVMAFIIFNSISIWINRISSSNSPSP